MPSSSPSPFDPQQTITFLLTEIVTLLTRELSIVVDRRWEELPSLKKEKVVLASRLKSIDWSAAPVQEEPANWSSLKSRIASLEAECRRIVQAQMELITQQIVALQDLHQYWRECLSISFGSFAPTASAC